MRPGRLEPSNVTTATVHKLEEPTSKMELRSILGLCSEFRHFPNFSRVAALFNNKLRKDQQSSLPPVIQAKSGAVENHETLLTTTLVLALPRATGQYTVDSDACDSQVRSALLRKQKEGTA